MNTKDKRPTIGRLIFCEGSDWSDFRCVGKLEMRSGYKRPTFMLRNLDGAFQSDRNTWLDVDRWRYVEDGEDPDKLIRSK